MSGLLAQARVELLLTARRGESVVLTVGIPLLLLGFFATVDVLPTGGTREAIDVLAPGVLAVAIMSTAMVQVAIGTAFERQYGVLKRLGATPLSRPALLTAKTASVAAIESIQVVLVVGLAVALGWDPGFSWDAVGLAGLGTMAFAGIGMFMAGSLRGEATLAAANGLYLVLLLLGGMVVPLSELPDGLRVVAQALPGGALADGLTGALSGGQWDAARDWVVLGVWAVAAPAAAVATFRWE